MNPAGEHRAWSKGATIGHGLQPRRLSPRSAGANRERVMPVYRFNADIGTKLPGGAPTAPAILSELDRLGLRHVGVQVARQGNLALLEGEVPDPEMRERLVLAIGNLRGIGEVEDRLTVAHRPGLLDSLGSFAQVPAGSVRMQAAETAMNKAEPEPGTVFGPGGSLFHTVQPGESLAELARRHYGDATQLPVLMAANAPMLPPGEPPPGWVLRIPPQ
jgi:nucleoid-associated protein YgaU